MSDTYQDLLSEVRAAYAASTEATLAQVRAQDAVQAAGQRVFRATQALTETEYVESLEVQIEAPPS